MAKNYSDLLVEFKDKINKIEDNPPDYALLQACCVDFFNDSEGFSTKNNKKSLEYLKLFDFNSLYVREPNAGGRLVEKKFFILASILTMAIDKYGVNLVLKELLPEKIQSAQRSLFYHVINWFLSLFRETKINLKQISDLDEALAMAVTYLEEESISARKNLFYLDRGGPFILVLNELCLTVIEKYGNPLKSHSLYLRMGLKIAVNDKLVREYSRSSSFASIPLNDQDQAATEAEVEDVLWLEDEEWDDDEEDDWDESNSVSQKEPIYANIPVDSVVLEHPLATAFSFQEPPAIDALSASSLPPSSALSPPASPGLASTPPSPPPLPLSPFALSVAQADREHMGTNVQMVEKNPSDLVNTLIKQAEGNDNRNPTVRVSIAREPLAYSDTGTSNEISSQYEFSDIDGKLRQQAIHRKKSGMCTETCEPETTETPVLIALESMNGHLNLSGLVSNPFVNENLSASSATIPLPEPSSDNARPELKPKPENIAKLLAKSLERGVLGSASPINVPSQSFSQVGMVIKVN